MAHSSESGPPHAVRLGARGRLVLPAAIRRQLGLRTGDTLVVSIEEEGAVCLTRLHRQLRAMQGVFRKDTKRVLSRELIRERRRESAGDNSQ